MADSPRLGLRRPLGTEVANVDDDIRNIVDDLDPVIITISSGLASALPTSSATLAPRFYRETDTGVLRLDTGSGWVIVENRMVRGQVGQLGGLNLGTGFTVARTAAGSYTVTYSSTWAPAFPVPVVTPVTAGDVIRTADIGSSSQTAFTVFTRDQDGVKVDTAFNFFAIAS